MKKALSIILMAALMAASLAGCSGGSGGSSAGSSSAGGSASSSRAEEDTSGDGYGETGGDTEDGNFNETGYPIVNEKLDLEVLFQIRDQDSLMPINDMKVIQDYEEKTNIHTEWEVVKESDWPTKSNLMFASGEYPDIIISGAVDCEEYGVTQKLLLPLDDLIDKYMPIYKERAEADEVDVLQGLIASDEQMYSLGYLVSQNIKVEAPFHINQAWLDTLGLDMPETIDELTEVLRAFKTGDPNGNGQPDEIPFEMGIDAGFYGVARILPLFGLPSTAPPDRWLFMDEDGKANFSPTQDSFRECMEWLHMLYEEDLLDPEVISQDYVTAETKILAGDIGFFSVWRLIAMGFDDKVLEECTLYVPGEGAMFPRIMEVARPWAYVTSSNEHVPETMRWLDGMFETETMFSMYYGEQGTGWDYLDSGKIESLVTGEVEVRDYLDANALFFAPGGYYFDTLEMPPQRIEKTDSSNAYDDAGIVQKYSNDLFKLAPRTADEVADCTMIETDINNAVLENIAVFITDGVTDDSWQKFVSIFDDMGTDDYVAIYQAAIDRMEQ